MNDEIMISEIKGASIFRGTNCEDGNDWTLVEAAEAEAYSRQCAKSATTTVSPSNGFWVSWDDDHDVEAKSKFDILVSKIMDAERKNFAS